MGFLSKLFGGKKSQSAMLENMQQAVDDLNELLDGNEQAEVSPKIQKLAYDIFMPIEQGATTLTLQAKWMAIAHAISLFTWDRYGTKFSQDECIVLARSFITLELSAYFQNSSGGDVPSWVADWYEEAVAQQVLATQVVTPLMHCFLGQLDIAQSMADGSKKMATLPENQLQKTFTAVFGE